MSSKIHSKRIFKVVLAVAILGLLVFLNPKNIFSPFRNIFLEGMYPFEKVSYVFSTALKNSSGVLADIGNIKKENEDLLNQNQELLAENAKLEDMEDENNLLRQQLDLLPRSQFDLETADIIGQDSLGLGNWIEIDKGGNDGIGKDMSVIVSDGILVGKVSEVSPKTSKVVLITNPEAAINAMDENTGAKGMVKGEFGLGTILSMVLETDSLNKGDQVITSGIGGDMPKGLLIGKISDIGQSQDRLFQEAVITSPIKFSSLEFVSVIKN